MYVELISDDLDIEHDDEGGVGGYNNIDVIVINDDDGDIGHDNGSKGCTVTLGCRILVFVINNKSIKAKKLSKCQINIFDADSISFGRTIRKAGESISHTPILEQSENETVSMRSTCQLSLCRKRKNSEKDVSGDFLECSVRGTPNG